MMPDCFFFISDCMSPGKGGSGTVNSILLDFIGDKNCIPVSSGKTVVNPSRFIHTAGFNYSFLPKRLLVYGHLVSVLFARFKIAALIRKYRPAFIIAAYPQLTLFTAAVREANRYGIPYFAYLHDTVEEALSRGSLKKQATETQKLVFRTAAGIFVISNGMQDLYTRKYGLNTTVVRHIYPEEPFHVPGMSNGKVFWSGAVYGINHRALARMTHACARKGLYATFTGNTSENDLRLFGFPTSYIHQHYYSRRSDYLSAVAQHSLLLLCLNWPDESTVHPDEMATIFPTKTPEYLASGVPIAVHCPAGYFLADFFREHACGLVISSRDENEIAGQLSAFLANKPMQMEMVARARALKYLFEPELNAGNLKKTVGSALQSSSSRRENSLDSQ